MTRVARLHTPSLPAGAGFGSRSRRATVSPHPRLVQVGKYPLSTMFGMCSCFLLICFACQRQFALLVHQELAGSHFDEDQRLRAEAELAKAADPTPDAPDSQVV